MESETHLLSHKEQPDSLESVVQKIKTRLQQEGDRPYATVEKLTELVDQLTEFEFGCFLLQNQGGLNGSWTYRVITRPELSGSYSSALEEFLFLKAPSILATRERYGIFQAVLQESLRDGMIIASLPCGVMADLLSLNFDGFKDISLTGIDLDLDALTLAKKMAEEKGLLEKCEFTQKDAWNLGQPEQYDLLTSNGLNIYEKSDARVTALYREFYKALKPSGMLLTSFLTPPPVAGQVCEWDFDHINEEDLTKQLMLMVDILRATWTCFRSSDLTLAQLQQAGFQNIEIIPGTSGMFPTVKAYK